MALEGCYVNGESRGRNTLGNDEEDFTYTSACYLVARLAFLTELSQGLQRITD